MAVFVVASLAGCSSDGDQTMEITHDACAPLALVSTDATVMQSAAIDGAQQLWRDFGAPALGLRAGATLEVKFEHASLAFRGLYDDEHGLIYINDDLLDEAKLRIVIAHELGHAFGLPHVDPSERISVMNPGNLETAPNDSDRLALEALWGPCE